jgi:NifU-like protein involved in Fe-S cluster formation
MSRYSEILMDHFESPRNAGVLPPPCETGHASLPGGAPRMTIYVRTQDGVVEQATFQTFGCGVSVACCSVLTEMVANRQVAECLEITPQQIEDALDGLPIEKRFCASLAVEALRNALARLEAK